MQRIRKDESRREREREREREGEREGKREGWQKTQTKKLAEGWRRKVREGTFFQRWKYRYTLILVGESNYCLLGRSVREDRDAKRGESSNHKVRAIVWPSQHEGSLRIPSANFPFEDLSACRYPPGQQRRSFIPDPALLTNSSLSPSLSFYARCVSRFSS